MEPDKLHNRLTALDGLRGFAILLVFLSHINTSYLNNILPNGLLFSWIYSNGVTGVTFLFILSGFLMSTIYPNPASVSGFLQKRYTRIFPLFLTMCAVMFTGSITQSNSPIILIAILLGYAAVTYLIWTQIIKRLPKKLGTLLFYLFLILQAITACFYIFWINKVSFAAFSSLPAAVHEGAIFLVNATLTLPLGQYVPMLDGVYWTLVAEVLFYVLYPTVVVPLAKFLAHKGLVTKIVFLLCLIPFLGGIHMLSYKIFVISLIQPALFFYFATGVFLGYLYRNHTIHFEKFSKKIFPKYLALLPFVLFFATIAFINDLSFLGQVISPWIRMLFAVPLTFFVAILLDRNTLFSKFFGSRVLAYVGTISYSIYLSHSLIIHIAGLIIKPPSTALNVLYIVVVLAVNIVIASVLFYLLERPYFHKSKDAKKMNSIQQKAKFLPVQYLFVLICFFYIISIFAAYQSKNSLNFFSITQPISNNDFSQKGIASKLVLTISSPLIITVHAKEDNLGLISLQVSHILIRNSKYPQAILFSLHDGGRQITSSAYSVDQFNKDLEFPFGFPAQVNSRGKTYKAKFTLSNPSSSDTVTFNTSSGELTYSANKKTLLTHPSQMMQFALLKMQSALQSSDARLTLLFLVPFLLFGFFSLRLGKK